MQPNWYVLYQQDKFTIKTILDKPGNQGTGRPPDTQHGQKVSGRKWEKLQEERSINGKVTANTQTETGVQSGHSHPIGRATGCQTEDTGNEEGQVESRSTSNNI